MSNNESFIDEVSDEVRRDRLYATFRRYGWIGVVLVILVVGGTAWTQYSAAREISAAEARGNALLDALGADSPEARAEALSQVEITGPAAGIAGFLTAEAQLAAGEPGAAAETLRGVAANAAVEPLYRELARLKAAMADDSLSPEARIEALDPLAQPGAPLRLIAMEQQALAQIAGADRDAALGTLEAVLEDAELTQGLRDRASALIVSLGGDVPPNAGAVAADQ